MGEYESRSEHNSNSTKFPQQVRSYLYTNAFSAKKRETNLANPLSKALAGCANTNKESKVESGNILEEFEK